MNDSVAVKGGGAHLEQMPRSRNDAALPSLANDFLLGRAHNKSDGSSVSANADGREDHRRLAEGAAVCFRAEAPAWMNFSTAPELLGFFLTEATHRAAHRYGDSYFDRLCLRDLSVQFLSPVCPGQIFDISCHFQRDNLGGWLEVDADCRANGQNSARIRLVYEGDRWM